MAYQYDLLEVKFEYPFNEWRARYDEGRAKCTEANCDRIEKIFDELIESLIRAGEDAPEETKMRCFKVAILKTNYFHRLEDYFIEKEEGDDLRELTDRITIACGLDPVCYGLANGIAHLWRDW